MSYADLTNDYVFRKVFGEHPEALRGLLNDLLDRSGAHEITEIEYLPGEQVPLVFGQKLSILDLRCRSRGGEVFVVEMQNLHVTGFLNRVIYNACKAYVGTLLKGRPYDSLTDVVAVSICNFELWTDADQKARQQPLVPLVSRWSMSERASGAVSLGQVQYVFLELPKLRDRVLTNAVERWAAIFLSAPMLDPAQMAREPLTAAQREALDSAREETFSASERDAIQRAYEEVDQVRRIVAHEVAKARVEAEAEGRAEGKAEGKAEGRAEGKAEGRAEGKAEGRAEGLRVAITALCDVLGVELTESRQRGLTESDVSTLSDMLDQIKRTRQWPG